MNAPPRRNSASTPCIRLCVVDADSGLCAGCGRTTAEIGAWMGLSEDERRAVMDVLPARLARLSRQGAGP